MRLRYHHIILLVLFTSGCANQYVLHWRKPTKIWHIFSKPKEFTAISNVNGIALLYDRTPWVLVDPMLDDNSAWVYYALVLKNDSSKPTKIITSKVQLESDNDFFPMSFQESDKKKDWDEIPAHSLVRITGKFHISKQFIGKYGNSSDSFKLVVPLEGKQSLSQELWLWGE